ncbi:MAGUK p55 subfamily member 5 [Echinococcus granulosus]|uniref:MAGUK p55 subfamily n=1 Tax=Echinococcus granulosus TaxID=6210 RepID=A0A068WPQ3_ECHGR|nr:MAGUK p55 subfamily member 5 [Echinococcus granulosus]CDS19614.1 MAGUK p55 subfamily [Echinococcus granulosus]
MSEHLDSPEDKVTFFNDTSQHLTATTDVRDYARQLSERKRLEDQRRQEDRFLRRSLRQSDKLRSLARAKKVAKELREIVAARSNLAFDDSEEGINHGDFVSNLRRRLKKGGGADGDSSDIDGRDDEEWEWLANKVSDRSVLQAFNLHNVIASVFERTCEKLGDIPMELWAGDDSALQSLSAVTWDLKNIPLNGRTSQMEELLTILRKPQVVETLTAYDDVKQVWSEQVEKREVPVQDDSDAGAMERTVYPSPVEGCYKILAVDDQGNTVSTPDGTTLVNVILQKSGEDFFGATVRNEGSAIVIGRIISGGLIERTGLLNEGDELLSVNGIDLMGKDVDHVSHILTNLDGNIDLLVAPVVPVTEASLFQEEPVAHLRALFSYEPSNDIYNPCPEASIAFDKGDILRILNTRDPNWWQALRIEEAGAVGVSGSMAGLVPSPYFQRYRCLLRMEREGAYAEDAAAGYSESEASEQDDATADAEHGFVDSDISSMDTSRSSLSLWMSSNMNTPTCGNDGQGFESLDKEYLWSSHGVGPKQLKKLRRKKSRKTRFLSMVTSRFMHSTPRRANEYEISKEIANLRQTDGDQLQQLVEESVREKIRRPSLLTYELVDLYYPQPERKRPLVLVGPKHVGRQQLIEGLLRSEPRRFAMPAIHTTDPEAKSTELQTYETVTKQDFHRLHKERAFVEWGVCNHHYYGTKVASIETIIKAGKVCVLALRPDSIRAIRRTPFLPCVIFVSPPDNLEEMRQLSKQWTSSAANITDEELKVCIEESQKMEQHYGHFFEFIIIPRTSKTALAELKQVALDLERRPQWVPAQWIDLAWQVAVQASVNATAVTNETALIMSG